MDLTELELMRRHVSMPTTSHRILTRVAKEEENFFGLLFFLELLSYHGHHINLCMDPHLEDALGILLGILCGFKNTSENLN